MGCGRKCIRNVLKGEYDNDMSYFTGFRVYWLNKVMV